MSRVEANREETAKFAVRLGGVAALGAGLGVAAWVFALPFPVYVVAGLLLAGGGLGGATLLATGGAWRAPCPSCGATIGSLDLPERFQLGQDKLFACPSCATWVMGKDTLAAVPAGYLHPTPVFEAPLPDTFVFPEGCPVCETPATTTVRLEGHDAVGVAVTGVTGGMRRVAVIEAPACDRHRDGVAIGRGPGGDVIRFRRYDTWVRWVALNG